jgi:hypothetical protein
MTLDEIIQDIHACEADLLVYERKYGVLSETFYESYMSGEEPADDAWVLDWSDWAGTYEIWLRRRQQCLPYRVSQASNGKNLIRFFLNSL